MPTITKTIHPEIIECDATQDYCLCQTCAKWCHLIEERDNGRRCTWKCLGACISYNENDFKCPTQKCEKYIIRTTPPSKKEADTQHSMVSSKKKRI